MIGKIMTVLGFADEQDEEIEQDNSSRRSYPRRVSDNCIGMVNGQAMPVLDWSPGGLRVFGDTRMVNLGDSVDVTLKFHTGGSLIDINHRAHVVRKAAETFAVQFEPLTGEIRRAFQHIIDSFNADEFAASQAS